MRLERLTFISTLFALFLVSAPASSLSAKARKVKPLPPKRSAAAVASASRSAGSAGRAAWMTALRTVRVTDSAAGTYYSEITALAVDSSHLVVPWTFIAEVSLNRAGARFFADGSGRDLTLVDVDLSANLALLKSADPTSRALSRDQIRLDLPKSNEAFFAVSASGEARTGARFSGVLNEGSFPRYLVHFSSDDGARVRYIFDSAGLLTAVFTRTDESRWAASSRAVYELLRRQEGPRPASASANYQRRSQLYYWQNRWTQSLLSSGARLSLGGLNCQTRLSSIADKALASQLKNIHSLDCEEKLSLPVVNDYSAGLRVSTGDALLRSSDLESGRKLLQSVSEDAFGDLEKSAALVNLMTVANCRDNKVDNPGGAHLLVKFCTSALKFEPGLADTAIAVTSLDTGARAHYAVARLKGFDRENTRRVLRAMIESIRSQR